MSAPARRSLARAAQSASTIGSTTPVTVTSASLRRAAARPSPINTSPAQAQQQVPAQRAFSTATPVRPKTTGPTAVTTWTARVKEAVERSRARAYSQDAKVENKIWGFEEVGPYISMLCRLVYDAGSFRQKGCQEVSRKRWKKIRRVEEE